MIASLDQSLNMQQQTVYMKLDGLLFSFLEDLARSRLNHA